MARLLVWLALAALVWWIVRPRPRVPPPARDGAARGTPAPAERMVTCAHCGVHLPESACVRDDASRPYCGPEHRVAGPRPR